MAEMRFWCLFLGPGKFETLVEARYQSPTTIGCGKPIILQTNDTHTLEISVYVSPDWPSSTDQIVPP